MSSKTRADKLLGFDAREMWYEPSFLKEIPGEELLRKDIARPLSVDPIVWPSLFDTGFDTGAVDTGDGTGLSEAGREHLASTRLELPSWIGPNFPFWANLEEMQQYLATHASSIRRPYWTIAVSWFSGKDCSQGFSEASEKGPYINLTVPAVRDEAWQFCGYDVADISRASGLLSFRYEPDELRLFRGRWGPYINRSYLFVDGEQALELSELLNSRIPEHAPFFVYGLWQISATE